MRSRTIEFWFDFASTYCYPAAMRIEAVAARHGIAISWHAFLLGPIFNHQGWDDSPFNIYPTKGAYMWRDMERLCSDLHLPFQRPSTFPRNGLMAARIACRHASADWLPEFVRAVYHANFARDRDISTPNVIADCLHTAGQPSDAILSEASQPSVKEALRKETEQAIQRGVFGAPFFFAGDEPFWGNDRLERAITALGT